MKPIGLGQSGPAVEDVQQRLSTLGFDIASNELELHEFGESTQAAVRDFRIRQGLEPLGEVDDATWIELVDETYELGDRTLYLRLPYYHGADVKHLQMTLNVLGFSCGPVDGLYGPHTEAAVAAFQANVGLMADGMAFSDTFDAIERLHHVWKGKTASPEFSIPHAGLARAVDILEQTRLLVTATDPIARSVASRIWNVAYATTDDAQVELINSWDRAQEDKSKPEADLMVIVATAPLEKGEKLPKGTVKLVCNEYDELTSRITTALVGTDSKRRKAIRIELPQLNNYDGSITNRTVQTAAVSLLDALCSALSAVGA
ncbi:MAG: peptidoglycan-binding protein [Coriobacteriales bacterium]|nr:peptidoglycan-binding protein [Coriobacteriales bacterium]